MLERLDAAVSAALGPLQGAVQSGAEDSVLQAHAQVVLVNAIPGIDLSLYPGLFTCN